jgi:hypothetical protein
VDTKDAWKQGDYPGWFSGELEKMQAGMQLGGGVGRITFEMLPEPHFTVSRARSVEDLNAPDRSGSH